MTSPQHLHGPAVAQETVQPPLRPGETLLARLSLDLDERLHFAAGELVLTGERLLARSGEGPWQAHTLSPDQTLRHADHAGVGTLELCSATERLARWRFTLTANVQALRLVKRFEQLQAARAHGHAIEGEDPTRCPSCRNPLPDEQIFEAMLWVMAHAKLVVEGAAAAPVAALLHGLVKAPPGARVVCVLSGGNVNLDQLRGLRWN